MVMLNVLEQRQAPDGNMGKIIALKNAKFPRSP